MMIRASEMRRRNKRKTTNKTIGRQIARFSLTLRAEISTGAKFLMTNTQRGESVGAKKRKAHPEHGRNERKFLRKRRRQNERIEEFSEMKRVGRHLIAAPVWAEMTLRIWTSEPMP